MNILNSVNDLKTKLTSDADDKDRQREIAEQGLTDEGAFPTLAKFVVFGVLIALNVRLFVSAVGGKFGYIVAGAAVMSGLFAIYCWNRVDKSKGKHLRVMQFGAAGFTILEIVHATASVWDYMQWMDAAAKAWAITYSHKYAFPLMAASIVIGFAAHRYTFWTAEINKARAQSQITIAIEEANLDTQMARMRNEQRLAQANLDHLRAMRKIEAETQAEVAQMESSVALPQKPTLVATKHAAGSGYVNGAANPN